MTLQQVKEELEELYIKNKMLHSNCVQNSLILVWHWKLKPYLVFLSGHCVVVCPKLGVLIDPTVGCMWNCTKLNKEFLKQLFNGKRPDEYLSWYLEGKYQRWWDYSFKYEKNKHRFQTKEEWDIDLNFEVISLNSQVLNTYYLGKFSDYMR